MLSLSVSRMALLVSATQSKSVIFDGNHRWPCDMAENDKSVIFDGTLGSDPMSEDGKGVLHKSIAGLCVPEKCYSAEQNVSGGGPSHVYAGYLCNDGSSFGITTNSEPEESDPLADELRFECDMAEGSDPMSENGKGVLHESIPDLCVPEECYQAKQDMSGGGFSPNGSGSITSGYKCADGLRFSIVSTFDGGAYDDVVVPVLEDDEPVEVDIVKVIEDEGQPWFDAGEQVPLADEAAGQNTGKASMRGRAEEKSASPRAAFTASALALSVFALA